MARSTRWKSAFITVALLGVLLGLFAPAAWTAHADGGSDRPVSYDVETFVDENGHEFAWIFVPGKPPDDAPWKAVWENAERGEPRPPEAD